MSIFSILSKEAQFVQRIHAGDRKAEREFFDYCYGYCMKTQGGNSFFSKDRFQDALVTVWTDIQNGRIFLKDGDIWRIPKVGKSEAARMTCSLRSFIIDICKNLAFKEARKKEAPFPYPPKDMPDEDIDAFLREEKEIQFRIIDLCIEEMSAHCRDILTQYYVKGLKLDQIMQSRGAHESKNGLKSSKSKCLGKLKEAAITIYRSLYL